MQILPSCKTSRCTCNKLQLPTLVSRPPQVITLCLPFDIPSPTTLQPPQGLGMCSALCPESSLPSIVWLAASQLRCHWPLHLKPPSTPVVSFYRSPWFGPPYSSWYYLSDDFYVACSPRQVSSVGFGPAGSVVSQSRARHWPRRCSVEIC